jgi:tetratricopeptide (TPR) repeat protein
LLPIARWSGRTERQIRAALDIVGEKNIPPERLAAKLIEIAQNFNDLKSASTAEPGDDAEIEALRQQVQAAIDSGDLVRGDSVLAQIEMKQRAALEQQRAALDRLASNAAATIERRGEVALARLHYLDAAKQFGEAVRLLPQTVDFSKQRLEYLDQEALALYRQGDEFGDNAALVSAIDRCRTLLLLRPRERAPLQWAMTQNHLGTALAALGERESGTGKLTATVAAYRAALEEWTRARSTPMGHDPDESRQRAYKAQGAGERDGEAHGGGRGLSRHAGGNDAAN